jgi:Family of unknown function (DUF6491)
MRATFFLAGLFLALGSAVSSAQTLAHCFTDTQFDGWWRAAGDRTLYIRTSAARYYRLDLAQQCSVSGIPGAHLILRVHGSDTICSPLDFDLRVSGGVGDIPYPCFVKKMSEVAASEAVAVQNRKP